MPYVGVFGGTFDPIHLGHLAAAQGAVERLGLDQVLFLPNRQPPHKAGRPVTPALHRAAMVRLAVESNDRFGFSGLELEREGPSYTIHTVRAFQERHPDWRLAFLVGMDSLLEIQTWLEYRTLLTLVDLVVFSRPGYADDRRDQVLAELGPDLIRRIHLLELPGVAVSATELRRLGEQGMSLRYLVPDSVARYIREHRLYEPNTADR